MTAIQWADEIELLGPGRVLAQVMFTDEHSTTHWPIGLGVGLLAPTSTADAHCPGVFARNGQALESLGIHVRRGVRLGTDNSPYSMFEKMQAAVILARVVTGDVGSVATSEVLHAATTGGADILGRPDLGRIAVGCKVDPVLADQTHPGMMPIRDRLRSLILVAPDRAVFEIFGDGVHVLVDGAVATVDVEAVAIELQLVRDRAEQDARARQCDGWAAIEVVLLSLHGG